MHLITMAGFIKLADVDDLKESIEAKFTDLYSSFGSNVFSTIALDVVQVGTSGTAAVVFA